MEGRHVIVIENKDYAIWSIMIAWTVVLMYTGLFKSAESFLKVDVVMNVVQGILWLVFPVAMLKGIEIGAAVGDLDGGHLVLACMSGALLLYTCAIVWVCATAEENTVITSILWSKLTLGVLYIAVETYHFCHYRKDAGPADEWTKMDVMYSLCMMMFAVWVTCAVVQLRRFDQWGGYPEHSNRLNVHIRLDYIITLVVGLSLLTYPELVLRYTTLNEHHDRLHVYVTRCASIMLIHSALLTGSAPKFLIEMPKVRLLFCRLVMCVVLTAVYLMTLHYHRLLVIASIPRTLVLPALWGGNALSGFLFSRYGQLK